MPAGSDVRVAAGGHARRRADQDVRSHTMAQMPLFDVAAGETPAATPADVHAISIPARAFTGDFYFTHRYADRLWFALGDVAGKGLNAAVIMAMIQEELEHRIHSCALTRCDPSRTTQRLHEFLRPVVPPNRFASAVIGHLCADGSLAVVNAGHCPPLIIRQDRIERIESTGPVLGPLPFSRWRTFQTALAPGDALVLYSDGVVEAESPEGKEFEIAGIERALPAGAASAGEMAGRILAGVMRHSGANLGDDLTLVVVRR